MGVSTRMSDGDDHTSRSRSQSLVELLLLLFNPEERKTTERINGREEKQSQYIQSIVFELYLNYCIVLPKTFF